jgi:hypothetical protein
MNARSTIVAATALALMPVRQAGPLDGLGWLAGCWEMRRGPRVTLEMWMPPAGNLMLGASRTLNNGAVREFEQLRLEWRDDRLVYTALPSGQSEASFTSATKPEGGFAVENLTHDYPQRVIYKGRGSDSLVARIEAGDGSKGVEFPMRRVSCDGAR